MSGIYEIGSRGERLLADYLRARGRAVAPSDRKTFDLVVDGRYAEVKTSDAPYAKLGFIGLTDAQYRELKNGTSFSIFVVCNARQPEQLEVMEFDASELLKEDPKIECTYYWYRSHLEKCRALEQAQVKPGKSTSAPAAVAAPDRERSVVVGELMAHIRRLAATEVADLYVRLDQIDVARLQLSDRQLVTLKFGGGATLHGMLRTKAASPWIGPAPGSSNSAISAELRHAGFHHGDNVKAIISTL